MVEFAQKAKTESLLRLERGEITLEDYLDERTEEALAPLKGKVAPATLDSLRFTLRERLRTDPVLVESVRRTTGIIPKPLIEPGK